MYPFAIGGGHGLTANETVCLKQCPPVRSDLTKVGLTFTTDTGVDTKIATFRYIKASDNKCYETCSLWRDVTVNGFTNTRSCVNCCAAEVLNGSGVVTTPREYIKTTSDDSNNTVRCVASPTASEYWYEHATVDVGCTAQREIINITSCGGSYTSVNPSSTKSVFNSNFTLKARSSDPVNQCLATCPGSDLPDIANVDSNQYNCQEKCNKNGTYKFRTTVSGKPVCDTTCAS